MDSEIYSQIPSSLLNQTLTPKSIFFHLLSQPQFARGDGSENRERWPELGGEKKIERERESRGGRFRLEMSFPRYECNGFMSSFGFLLLLVEIRSSLPHFCNCHGTFGNFSFM